MPAERKPSGNKHGAQKTLHQDDFPSLGWDEFFHSLVTERTPDHRLALPRGIQE